MEEMHPLPPQWRRCQKGTREESSSIHYRHSGGDAKKAHVGRSNYGESRYFVCFHRSQRIVLIICPVIIQFQPLPTQWRRCQKGQFHPLPPQWRRCQKGTREASSSIQYCHNGGDARKAHVKHPVPSNTATMEEMPERHT